MAIKRNIILIPCLLICISLVMFSCGSSDSSSSSTSDEEIVRPDGWTDTTHGDDATAQYDVVFNETEVGEINLNISYSNWQSMLTDENIVSVYGNFGGSSNMRGPLELTENPVWVPCTFEFNGITWNYVGVRFKGNSTLRDAWTSGTYKIPFRFDFDEFEDTYTSIDDQRFYGFKKLTLSSGYKDESLIREKVTADIFRGMGVPAPRTSFYKLFIDCNDGEGSKYFGLYTMVEVPADPMLEDQFDYSDGNLYKPDGNTASFGGGALSEEEFDKKTNEDEADYSDVNALYTAINDTASDSDTWKNNLEDVLDVDGFLRWLAVNTVIQNWDTYGVMTHNYYLYNDGGLLKWIPWDNNEALKDSDAAIRSPLSLELDDADLDNWPLISRILEQSDYRTIYNGYVQQTIDEYFNSATMDTIYDAAYELIYDYVVGEEGEQEGYTLLSSDEDFIDSLDYLKSHVVSRGTAVDNYLN